MAPILDKTVVPGLVVLFFCFLLSRSLSLTLSVCMCKSALCNKFPEDLSISSLITYPPPQTVLLCVYPVCLLLSLKEH